ncbi:MAG TPA: mechanosensitive ion channel family protein [Gemmatimonadales bacterium]|nr:mechanosensitive ion channel family protein [Gemmatimonadales bacterium]
MTVHFSSSAVWGRAARQGWLTERIPQQLLQEGPLQVQWWQWIGLLGAAPLLVVVAWLLQRLVIRTLRRFAGWTGPTWDDAVIPRLRAPVLLFLLAILLGPLTAMLQLQQEVDGFFIDAAKALAVVAVFWALLVAVGAVQQYLLERAAATGRTEARSLSPLGARIMRLLLLFMGLVAVLAQFRYPVTTLLAGLGVGGVAVALGAQKTFENVLGSVAISIDRPFRVGDWIEVEGISGLVEEIGLRSTRIRTMARTLITFPNGRLADQRVERHTARDRWLWNVTFGLTYDATVPQIEAIAADMERWLTGHPRIASGDVKFSGFGDHSLNLEVLSWFDTTDLWEFRQLRQHAGFELMRLIEHHGARLAVPIQRVVVSGGPLPAQTMSS